MEEGTDLLDDLLGEYDFSDAQSLLEESLPEWDLSIDDLLWGIMSGENVIPKEDLFSLCMDTILSEWLCRKELFATILLCGLLAAFCKMIAGLCENKQIVDLGYYFIYLLLSLFLFQAFGDVVVIVENCLETLCAFLSVLLPTYFLSVGMAVGTSSAVGFYQISLFIICMVEYIMLFLLVPACCIYMFLSIISGLSAEDRMAGILKLISKFVSYVLKTGLAFVAGLSTIRACISPVLDGVSYGAAKKIIAAIPGVGNVTDATLQMVTGSLLLIKNGIGVVILVILLLLCLVPVLRIGVIVLILKLGSALIGLVTDFRIVKCTDRIGSGSMQLLKVLLASFVLNFVSIAIVAMSRSV